MPHPDNRDCLSFGDALFLHLERAGMPLNVASVATFEGQLSLEDCIAYVVSKLPLIPRYRQRVVPAPFNLGPPEWCFDRKFDVHNHVHEMTLQHGTEHEFKAAAGEVLSANMDRTRPLWDLTLVRGLKGNRTGLIIRVHHCLADGISGVGMMNVLLDSSPERPAVAAEPRKSPGQSRARSSLVETLLESCFSTVQRVLTAESELLSFAERAVAGSGKPPVDGIPAASLPFEADAPMPSLEDLNRMLPELLAPAERLPFNVVCRGPQKFEWAEIPVPALKAIKHACGVTLNDVVLALITSAVRRYVQVHGVNVRGRSLRVVVPVSVRRKTEMGELGNHLTFVPVTVPLNLRRMRRLVDAVHTGVCLLKRGHVAELVGFFGTLLGTVPAPLQAVLGPLASQLPISTCNLICTNVPGPKAPLYLLGHKMLTSYPYVPIGGEMGINCAVLTYNGTAYFGFTSDAHAVPDSRLFPKFLMASFAKLKKETAIHIPRQVALRRTEHKSAVNEAASGMEVPPAAAGVIRFPKKPPLPPARAQEKAFRAAGD